MEDKNKSLGQILDEHQGNVTDKWSLYLRVYEELFHTLRYKPINLLEIGVQNGGSLEVWAKYFDKAKVIVGCDIDPACGKLSFESEKIRIVIADAVSDQAYASISALSNSFDLIIDDGSHVSADIIRTFARYFPTLVPGGYYIIEDLHCSYWEDFGGGLYDPYSSMAFLKRLADVVNSEHWGIAASRKDALSAFVQRYNLDLEEHSLSSILSVSFVNSVCIIRKSEPSETVLGVRVVRGKTANVNPGLAKQDGIAFTAYDQSANAWSRSVPIEPLYQYAIDQIDCIQELNAVEQNLKRISGSLLRKIADLSAAKISWLDRLRGRFSERYAASAARKWEIELIQESGLFDEAYYLARYRDVAETGAVPILHYLKHGSAERRNPNANFDARYYASRVDDDQLQGVSQLTHYILVGSIGGLSPERGR